MRPAKPAAGRRLTERIHGASLRAASFAVTWWALAEGRLQDAPMVLAIIALATCSSYFILPFGAWKWNLRAFLAFLPFFLRHSLSGGWNVAWLALHPRMPIRPTFHDFPLRLPDGLPSVFLAWTVSLLPGTASVRLEGGRLCIHILNAHAGFEDELRDLETRLARIFGT